jgi:O-antigen/teichoic acid export membrane protein
MTAHAITVSPRLRLLRRGVGATAAQGFYSLSNLVVGITVARSLGAAALGHFAFLFTLLTAFVAVQTAWVGDSLTVLDRSDPAIRRGLATTQWVHCLLGAVAGGTIAYLAGGIDVVSAVVFAALVAAWELEEFGRRVFMARLEFWKQAANDCSYLVLVAVSLLVYHRAFGLTLIGTLGCMAAASLAAFALGMASLPREERLAPPRSWRGGFGDVARFGAWRGAQGAAGYASQVAVRALVIVLASAAAMGQLEAARLVVAPLFTVTAAAANLTLAGFARTGRAVERGEQLRLFRLALSGMAGVCALYAATVLVFPEFFVHLLAGEAFAAHRVALLGWLVLACVVAFGAPISSLALVGRQAAPVFWSRLGGSVVGLCLAFGALIAWGSNFVPLALGVGAAVGLLLLWPYASPVPERPR